jgi:hypothetical protein
MSIVGAGVLHYFIWSIGGVSLDLLGVLIAVEGASLSPISGITRMTFLGWEYIYFKYHMDTCFETMHCNL